jgi:hypothetical protein
MGRDSSVGVTTCYRLDGLGIESRWGRDFAHPSRPPWDPPSHLYRVPFPAVKRPGHDLKHAPPSSVEVEERVELYLYTSSGPSWPVLGLALPLLFDSTINW